MKSGLKALHKWLPERNGSHVLVSHLNNCVPPQKLCLYTWGSMPAVGVRSTELSVAEKVRAHLSQCNACPNLHTAGALQHPLKLLMRHTAHAQHAVCSWRPACAPGFCLAHFKLRGQADGTCKIVLHAGHRSVWSTGADSGRWGSYSCCSINSLAGPVTHSQLRLTRLCKGVKKRNARRWPTVWNSAVGTGLPVPMCCTHCHCTSFFADSQHHAETSLRKTPTSQAVAQAALSKPSSLYQLLYRLTVDTCFCPMNKQYLRSRYSNNIPLS